MRAARNMTDVLGALSVLSSSTSPERDIALDEFYGKWKHDNLGEKEQTKAQERNTSGFRIC